MINRQKKQESEMVGQVYQNVPVYQIALRLPYRNSLKK